MKQRFASVVVLSFALLAVSLSTHAQASDNVIAAKVAFAFHVGDKLYPAGSYQVTRRFELSKELMIRADKGGDSSPISVITRLAATKHGEHATSGNLVFDRVGDERFLSEVWLPGEDGYLVRGTAEEHQHDIVESKP